MRALRAADDGMDAESVHDRQVQRHTRNRRDDLLLRLSLASSFPVSGRLAWPRSSVRGHLSLVLNTKNALEMLYSYSVPLISTCAVASKLRTRGELCARRVNVDGSGEIAIATDVGWT